MTSQNQAHREDAYPTCVPTSPCSNSSRLVRPRTQLSVFRAVRYRVDDSSSNRLIFRTRDVSRSHRLGQPTDKPSLRPEAVNNRLQPDRCRLCRGQALPKSKSTISRSTVQPRLASVTLGPSGVGLLTKQKAASCRQIASDPTLGHIPDS